ncbi:kynureninase [Haloferax mediterranei ATCC 33500]|uniref:Kynureninase n=1 Tax=Haloferax mediterranei (strain ATCC 33500 / DSM 1411 / JCM 8866 / NBRC 14739 / NCIMB 2177 / R-4) TaxID=523841 RepID=I3R7I8_HALMT|nr:kynureninase [Haloferax mediterranei]AFK20198.1 kynureninase [Haloferax mediterranei ATCC 33500]AHZ23573.1 kynureninase [Haloferax mediterranei ATCC 33500]ELZ99057.1 kynureninase [Haloferax mediterranei ATCC 33500]MDX5987045.1 kynureninase [Haloferax mediterranei ATCC 33500]QCQ76363.1 kynureninase [Haloferax mediterranei ATCC 33500]
MNDDESAVETARERDAADPLSDLRERFYVPDGELYMDGNSLGLFSVDAEDALEHVIDEWRELAIRGWTDADPDWHTYGERLGERLAPLVGADPEEVVVANSTTVNIHTLIGTFYDPDRGEKIVVDDLDFPTDHYAIRAQLRQHGRDPDEALRVVESRDGRTIDIEDVLAAIDDDVGMVFLPSVLYRSGQLFDIQTITEAAHDAGALAGFDLAHSIGAVPHRLSDIGVDFAVWCHYKYLNAGPGALAGLYVNERHFGVTPALAGWWGNARETQFDMALTYDPAHSAAAFQTGTISILATAPLDGALDIVEDAGGVAALREKSLALTDFLIELVDEHLPECEVGTPRDPAARGGHVAVEHPEAYRISLALKERGVIVDFRQPDVVRIAPVPSYVGFEDVYRTVEHLREVLDEKEYEEFEKQSGGVT